MAFPLRRDGGFFGMGDWGGGWMCESEVKSCWVYFEVYIYKGVKYLKVNQPGYAYDGYYLSVNNNGYLGLYSWSGATGWTLTFDEHLVSNYTKNAVGSQPMTQAAYYIAMPGNNLTHFSRQYNPELYAAMA